MKRLIHGPVAARHLERLFAGWPSNWPVSLSNLRDIVVITLRGMKLRLAGETAK